MARKALTATVEAMSAACVSSAGQTTITAMVAAVIAMDINANAPRGNFGS